MSAEPTTQYLGLHHVQLAIPVGGEDQARAFYVGVLAFAEIPKPPALAARGGLWVRAAGVELHLGIEDPFVPARKAHPGILVEDLEVVRRRVVAAGQDPALDATFPGFLRIYVDDPFGNRLEFMALDQA